MIFLGGLVGLFLGGVAATAVGLSFGVMTPLTGPLTPLLAPLVGLPGPVVIALVSLAVIILYVFTYALATVALLPSIATATGPGAPATTAPPPRPPALPANPLEGFMRGILIGMTAVLNFFVLALLGVSVPFVPGPLGVLVGLVVFLAVFPPVSASAFYQGVLGWLSWLMPMSHLATAVGLLLFLLNLPFAIAAALAAGAPSPVRFDVLTATLETTGGALIGLTGFAGGFNLGNFTFVTPGPPPGSRTPFNGAGPGGAIIGGLSSHETGHTLNVAVFSGVVTWINAIDENVLPLRRNSLAYGELAAESHLSRGGFGLAPGAAVVFVPRQHIALW